MIINDLTIKNSSNPKEMERENGEEE